MKDDDCMVVDRSTNQNVALSNKIYNRYTLYSKYEDFLVVRMLINDSDEFDSSISREDSIRWSEDYPAQLRFPDFEVMDKIEEGFEYRRACIY